MYKAKNLLAVVAVIGAISTVVSEWLLFYGVFAEVSVVAMEAVVESVVIFVGPYFAACYVHC